MSAQSVSNRGANKMFNRKLRISQAAVSFSLFAILCLSAAVESDHISAVHEVNFLVSIAKIAANSENGTQCGRDFQEFLTSLEAKQPWALKLIDSFGIIPKSFVWGNYFWFSSKELCYDLNTPYWISLSASNPHHGYLNQTSPFAMAFHMVYYNFSSPAYVDLKLQVEHTLHVGLCVPKVCSKSSIILYSNTYFASQQSDVQQLYGIATNAVDSKTPAFSWKFFTNLSVVLYILIIVVLIVLSILAEVIVRIGKRCTRTKTCEVIVEELGSRHSTLEKLILCFDIRANVEILLSTERSRHFLPVIAGLRTVVCLWVTLFHVYYYSLFTINNIPLLFSKLENFALQPVLQSCFYVDVFFVISAFLLVSNFLSNNQCLQTIKGNDFIDNLKLYLSLILHRYLRLMPVLIIIMIMSDIVYDFLDIFSPFRMDEYNGLYCRETWWYNILFINNFLDLKYICSSWSWYLGCEMQYFIVFLLLLFVHAKDELSGKILFATLAVCFLIISFVCNLVQGITFHLDDVSNTLEYLYVKPWVRVNTYFAGALMGWFHFKTKSKALKLSPQFKFCFWFLVAIVYLASIYMSFWRSAPIWVVAGIMSFGKTLFGLIVGSVILLCQQGHGKVFNDLMGCKLFLILNKFSFSVYMVAPVIVVTAYGMRTESTQFSEMSSALDFIAIIVLSLASSILLVLLVEIPFQKLSNKFVLKRS